MDDPKVTTIKGHITFYSPQRLKQNTEIAENSLQLTSHSPKKSTLEWEGYENFPLQFTVDVLPNHFCRDYSVSTLNICLFVCGGKGFAQLKFQVSVYVCTTILQYIFYYTSAIYPYFYISTLIFISLLLFLIFTSPTFLLISFTFCYLVMSFPTFDSA